jgi:hypothetical protein
MMSFCIKPFLCSSFVQSLDWTAVVFQILKSCGGELAALGDNLSSGIVFHALRGLTLSECEQLVDKNILQVVVLSLILLVDLCECNLILLLALASLHGTREQFLVNDDTAQRRIGLQGRILNVASLVAEDSTQQFLLW